MEDVGSALLPTLTAAPIHLHLTDVGLLALGLGFLAVWLVYFYRKTNDQCRRPGEGHGSSRWGTKRDIQPFENPEVSKLLSYDEVGIYEIGTEKTAFFMITSDNTSTYDFLGAMIFSLMFTKMFEQAYKDHGGRLPVHVRLILDEFANVGVLPDADKKLSVMRSRNMSASIVLQSISQLEKNYKDTKETLIDNCDSLLFLGSKSNKTNKEIAEQIGKATVHNTAVTESKGSSGSYSEADQILGRYLIDPAVTELTYTGEALIDDETNAASHLFACKERKGALLTVAVGAASTQYAIEGL